MFSVRNVLIGAGVALAIWYVFRDRSEPSEEKLVNDVLIPPQAVAVTAGEGRLFARSPVADAFKTLNRTGN